jgi:catechol 2,3-dioxygenase-like lactoylglutathione lyase family enzyme
MEAAKMEKEASVDMKLEVILLEVSDVERSKVFYEKLGWRLDGDFNSNEGEFRAVQMTPYNSGTSIIFGKGITSAGPGPAASLVLAVDDISAAREDLLNRGVDVSEVFHFAGGPFNNTGENPRVDGRDEEGRSYFSFVSFDDPDGNRWLVQEIKDRFPGREWKQEPQAVDVASLAELLHEAEQRHGEYEGSHAKHNWWDWYAPYLSARQQGSSAEESAAAADRHMDENFHVPRL